MFTHTYLICSMEEQYEYENSLGEDYSRDEWYYQNSMKTQDSEEEWDDFDDMEEGPEDDAEDWYFGEDKD